MKKNFTHSLVRCFIFGGTLIAFSGLAGAQVKNVFNINAAVESPISLAFDQYTNQLLMTSPFCGTPTPNNTVTGFRINSIDALGNVYLFANLPDHAVSTQHPGAPYAYCYEDYVAVSPGLGGFNAGDVFVTQGQKIVRVPPGGGTATTFTTLTGVTDTASGITFDTVGTFCYSMIVTQQDGKVFLVDSTGHSTLYANLLQTYNAGFSVEGATVAPASFGHYAGSLIVAVEAPAQVMAISAPAACPVTAPAATVNVALANLIAPPEVVKVVPPNACNFGPVAFGGSTGGTFFGLTFNPAMQFPPVSNLSHIVAYPASNFTGLAGNIMMPFEEYIPKVDMLSPSALSPYITESTFDSNSAAPTWQQLEDSTFATCPTTVGCILTPGGYKNNFRNKVTGLVIGGTYYSATDVTKMVSTGGGGIGGLGRSLAAAKLNVLYGALAPAAVQLAIIQADALIASVTTNVAPQKTIFQATLPSGQTDPLITVLEGFNNGLAPGGPTQECTR